MTDRHSLRMTFSELGLREGEESGGIFCPFCQATHENKLNVRRTGQGWVYNCYRAKCGEAGFVGTDALAYSVNEIRERQRPVKAHKTYDKIDTLDYLTDEDYEFFERTWGILVSTSEIFVTEDDEYAFRIRGSDGRFKAWHIRQPRWKGVVCHRKGAPGPKGMTYKGDAEDNKLAYTGDFLSDTLVIVEDYLSALKVGSCGVQAIALLGASMTAEAAVEIRERRYAKTFIWLDPDATAASYTMLSKYGLAFSDPRVVTSSEDPKDMTHEHIRRLLCLDL